MMHLSFQSCGNSAVITYQQLTTIFLASLQSRTAICCILATIAFLDRPAAQSLRRSRRLRNGATADSESAGESRHKKKKFKLRETASRTLVRLAVTNREVTIVPRTRHLASGPLVLFHRSKVAFRSRSRCHIFCGEQFWGRAVRASRDSLNPGRFLFVVKFPEERKFPRCYGCFQNYLPGSSESIGISSFFPDDKLR